MNYKDAGRRASQSGFTMLELILAVAILVLLIVVAVASFYDHQSHKSKRHAVQRLQEVAEWMHLQYATQPSYAAMLPPGWSTQDAEMKYRVSIAAQPVVASDPKATFPAVSETGFTLQAVPVEPDECGSLLLDHTGRKGVTGAGASVASCWQ